MRQLLGVALAVLVLCVPGASRAEEQFHGDVNFLIGQKQLEEDALEPNEDGAVVGAITTWGGEDWPVSLAADLVIYGDEEDAFDLSADELSLAIVEAAVGVRKIWRAGPIRPYLGAGIELVSADLEEGNFFFDDEDAEGSGVGVWANGGVFWRLGNHFNLGFDVRWNRAEVDLEFDDGGPDLEDVELGGLAGGLTLGFGW